MKRIGPEEADMTRHEEMDQEWTRHERRDQERTLISLYTGKSRTDQKNEETEQEEDGRPIKDMCSRPI